jgi:hypothetical protein
MIPLDQAALVIPNHMPPQNETQMGIRTRKIEDQHNASEL